MGKWFKARCTSVSRWNLPQKSSKSNAKVGFIAKRTFNYKEQSHFKKLCYLTLWFNVYVGTRDPIEMLSFSGVHTAFFPSFISATKQNRMKLKAEYDCCHWTLYIIHVALFLLCDFFILQILKHSIWNCSGNKQENCRGERWIEILNKKLVPLFW